MLSKCVNCGFYVRQDNEFCLNCGLENPIEEFSYPSNTTFQLLKLFRSKLLKLFIFVFLFFLLLFEVVDWEMSNVAFLKNYILFLIFVSTLGIVFFSFYLLEKWCLKKLNSKRGKNKDNFLSRKKIIDNRIAELNKRLKTINNFLDQTKNNTNKQLKDIHPDLLSAREVIVSHIARYEMQKQRIALLQTQNGMSPCLSDFYKLNEFETEKGLVAIETTKTEINRIRQNLTHYDAIDFSPKVLPEKTALLSQLSETETSCEKLREVLLSRQAALALREISPIEETVKLTASTKLLKEADVFNIQTTITDFSESFDELEREYRRFKSEDEIISHTDFQNQ